MAIAFGSSNVSGTNSVTYPTGIVAGSPLLLFYMTQDTPVPATPSGWTKLAAGVNSGVPQRLDCWGKIATGTESGSVTFTNDGSGTQATYMARYSTAGSVLFSAASATASGFPIFPITMTSDPGILAGDLAVGAFLSDDLTTVSSEAISAPGVSSWSAFSERNDTSPHSVFRFVTFDGTATAGASTGNPQISETGNSATNLIAFVIRLRELAGGFDPCGMLGLPGM